MKFQTDAHEQRYHEILSRMKNQNAYHKSAAYLMALADMVPDDVFDFTGNFIKYEGISAAWQTSSSRRATRLMFNLWNGWAHDEEFVERLTPSTEYAVDKSFCDYEYAPYFYEAVKIRFEW